LTYERGDSAGAKTNTNVYEMYTDDASKTVNARRGCAIVNITETTRKRKVFVLGLEPIIAACVRQDSAHHQHAIQQCATNQCKDVACAPLQTMNGTLDNPLKYLHHKQKSPKNEQCTTEISSQQHFIQFPWVAKISCVMRAGIQNPCIDIGISKC
jgi:hypothetical protein